eukprot:TRINITY_DN9618_c0_g1_i2.p1 TRINITY_DN9618_c0_g1~~TRINITY_DN9618_c0_g1_i2.p1  ORF type:complete len:477 (-),score=67.41 TRINITY_DN9618_c0_g1_i2:825-2162(-)
MLLFLLSILCAQCISTKQQVPFKEEALKEDYQLPKGIDDVSSLLKVWGEYQNDHEHDDEHGDQYAQDSPEKQYMLQVDNILQQIFQNKSNQFNPQLQSKVENYLEYQYDDFFANDKSSKNSMDNINKENFVDFSSDNKNYQDYYQKENRAGLEEIFGPISDNLYRQVFQNYVDSEENENSSFDDDQNSKNPVDSLNNLNQKFKQNQDYEKLYDLYQEIFQDHSYYQAYIDYIMLFDGNNAQNFVDFLNNFDQKTGKQEQNKDWEKWQEILEENQLNYEKFDYDYQLYNNIYDDIVDFEKYYNINENQISQDEKDPFLVEEFSTEKVPEQNFQIANEIHDQKQLIQTVNNIIQDAIKEMKQDEENSVKYTVININIKKDFMYLVIFLLTVLCFLVIFLYSQCIKNDQIIRQDINNQELESPLYRAFLEEAEKEELKVYNNPAKISA